MEMTMYLPTRTWRTPIMGPSGAVGTNHPLATQAGLDVLRAGGNAIDAAIAISLTLGVVEPAMSGLGGDGFFQVHEAKTGRTRCWNATGAAPFAATPDRFRARGIAVRGGLSVSTPGLLAGLGAMHAAHGTRKWETLCAAALGHARDGFAVTDNYRHFARDVRTHLAADRRSASVFLGGLAEGVPEFEPDPPPPPRQWSADELRAHEEKTKALHENFAAHLAGCAPDGWSLRPVWNEWHSSDGLYHADLLHYEIRTPEGVMVFCKGDYSGAITEGWSVEQDNCAFYSDITITAPDGRRLSFSDIMLA
ncbi:MAG: gamma-glutamyltransferase [Rhodospirillales bacterium]|nr:gamma-glutamyltransferase [Rhodospirillales bacterium]